MIWQKESGQTTVARLGAILLALFLTAFATAVTGPIASVAFLSGPIATRLTGHGRGNTMAAGLVGARAISGGDSRLFALRRGVMLSDPVPCR